MKPFLRSELASINDLRLPPLKPTALLCPIFNIQTPNLSSHYSQNSLQVKNNENTSQRLSILTFLAY